MQSIATIELLNTHWIVFFGTGHALVTPSCVFRRRFAVGDENSTPVS